MCVCVLYYILYIMIYIYMYTILYTMILFSLGDKFCSLLVNYALFIPLNNHSSCYQQITGNISLTSMIVSYFNIVMTSYF